MKSTTFGRLPLKFFFIVLIQLLVPAITVGQAEQKTEGERNVLFDDLRAGIISSVENGEIPSLAVGVMREGKILWSEAFGWADRENQIPATINTIYAVGSLSKSITATGLTLLVDRGQIRLNDPVSIYLGDLAPNRNFRSADQLKVKNLMTMTGGISHLYLQSTNTSKNLPRLSTEELVSRYGVVMFPVGTFFNYSNLSFAYPELLIGKVTGQTFSDFMEYEFFKPLGMTNSAVELDSSHRAKLAKGYDENGILLHGNIDFRPKGGGGLYTSIKDLIIYAQLHLLEPMGANSKIIGNEALAKIHETDNPELPSHNRYSHGWGSFELNGKTILISDGRIAGANSMLLLQPETGTAIVCLVNASGGQSMMNVMQIMDLLEPGFLGAAMEFIGAMEAADSPESEFAVTPKLAGKWQGSIQTDTEKIPLILNFTNEDSVEVRLGDEPAQTLAYPRYVDQPDTIVHGVKFSYRTLSGSFSGKIETRDTRNLVYDISLMLRHHKGKFVGEASVVGDGFKFPFFVELEKK